MKQGHPGPPVSGASEQEVLPDGHVTDEGEDEEHHAEHDEPQGAGYAHHSAPLPDRALTSGHQDTARRTRAAQANRTRTPDRLQGSSAEAEHLRLCDGRDTLTEEPKRGHGDDRVHQAEILSLNAQK